MRDYEGVVIAASCCQAFSLLDSEVAEALTMRKGLEFAKDMSFMNLIEESNAYNSSTIFYLVEVLTPSLFFYNTFLSLFCASHYLFFCL